MSLRVLHLTVFIAVGVVSPCLSQVSFTERSVEADVNDVHTPGPNFTLGIALMTPGGAVGDFDRNGLQDLFVVSGGGGPDRLYMNQGSGEFRDLAADWGLTAVHMGSAAAVGDINGDGWLDLYVTGFGDASGSLSTNGHKLYKNVGGTHFVELTSAGVSWSDDVPNAFSPAFGDYDLDGDLDLMVAGWVVGGGSVGGNRLFRNNGDETFTDVTAAADLLELGVQGFSPRFVDMNDDLYPELLLAADFGDARYYINDGDGTFTDFTVNSGTGLDCNAMGQTVADFNNDGLLDWYITNIYNDTNPKLRCGNMLYMNQGSHIFVESAESANVINGRWGWGTVGVDIDHDGFVDIVEVNGWLDGIGEPDTYANQPARVFMNQGNGSFIDEAASSGFAHVGQGRGLINFDYDNDGDQDFVVLSFDEPIELYRNDTITTNHWLRVFLDTSNNTGIAPDGVGAKLTLTCGVDTYVRFIDGGSNYLSQSELSAHFGIGSCTDIDALEIAWGNGAVSRWLEIPIDQTITLPAPLDTIGPGQLDKQTWPPGGIPATSTWLTVQLACLLLTCGTIILRRSSVEGEGLGTN